MDIGTEAAQFPEKEYINGIFLEVCRKSAKTLQGNKNPPMFQRGLKKVELRGLRILSQPYIIQY
jgi:hypothetical protein